MTTKHLGRGVAAAIATALVLFAAYGAYSLPDRMGRWHWPSGWVPLTAAWLAAVAAPLLLMHRDRWRPAGFAAALGLIGARVAVALLVDGRAPPGDAQMYLVLAEHLRSGQGYEIFEPYMGVETRALFPPLYPMVLALWSLAAGLSTASLTVLGLAIDLLAAGLLAQVARAIGRPRTGLAAAWLYLMWPSVLLSAPLAQKEGLCAVLTLLLALQWLRFAASDRPGVRDAIGIGLAGGLLALTQPGQLPLAGLFGIVAVGGGLRRLMAPALAAIPAAAAAIMLPWWVRNAVVLHAFVPLTSAGGYGLWVGNNPDADGHWMPPPSALHGLPEIAFGKAAGRLAMSWIAAHPLDFAKVTLAKALRGWGIAEFGAARLANMRPAPVAEVAGAAFGLAQSAHFALLGMAAAATRLGRTPGARPLLLLVAACIVQTLVFGALFEFGERHRDFATPLLLLLALMGLREGRTAAVT